MTSIERVGVSAYLTTEAPQYAIITYTWGRFQAPDGSPALPVKGTTWKIPPVKASCFSVDSFQAVVNYIGEKYDWLWLDVACIDQENEEVKMSEVARQTGIFHGAREAYAWLHSLPSDNATSDLSFLSSVANYNPIKRDYDSDESDDELDERARLIFVYYQSQLRSIADSLRAVFCDPWFTSLWTLQESILRRDACFLAANGWPIGYVKDEEASRSQNFTVNSLSSWCRTIARDLQRYVNEQKFSEIAKTEVEAIISLIDKAGFRFADAMNPNVQYGAARFRETKYPLDRIYGIIGIYRTVIPDNFQLPHPSTVTLTELEDAFALALNQASPWLAQCFVHLELPVLGRSWCISQASTVPSQFQDINTNLTLNTMGRIIAGASGPTIAQGKACPLRVLWTYWSRMRERGSTFLTTRLSYFFSIAYDHSISDLWTACLPQPPLGPIVEWINPELPDEDNDFRMTKHLVEKCSAQDLYVLLLGFQNNAGYNGIGQEEHAKNKAPRIYAFPDREELEELIVEEQGMAWGLRWEPAFLLQRKAFGLILMRDPPGVWRRIGICKWTDNHESGHCLLDWECEVC